MKKWTSGGSVALEGRLTEAERAKLEEFHKQRNSAAKPERYRDHQGGDWIDECARTMTPEEFRGAMKFTIGKYVRRAGKKDEIRQEIRKIADYAQRWLEYEDESGSA